MPFWKGCLIGVAATIVITLLSLFGSSVLHISDAWVWIVGLLLFASVYQLNLAEAHKVWIGSAFAILLSYAILMSPEISQTAGYGMNGIVVPVIVIMLIVAGFIAQKLTFVCNWATLITLLIFTIPGIRDDRHHLYYLKDLLYGAVCFWFIPVVVMKIIAWKNSKEA